jgi:Asp-tRNA(Asn)/Glu-tRNA(Gln) amidotransferase A subunit family amidase
MCNQAKAAPTGKGKDRKRNMRAEDSPLILTRRQTLSILGRAGIGTAVFQRALVAKAGDGPVTREMIADAEWVAGIKLTDAQRETAVNVLKWAREKAERVRTVEIDNSLLPGLNFTPLASPASLPDVRGYAAVKLAEPTHVQLSQPDSDEELAYRSIGRLGALLRTRKISSVELTKLYLGRLRRYDPLLKCVVTLTDDLALKQAERADRELQSRKDRGPLHGIPWGLKDIFAYPGYPTTWGVGRYRDRIIDVKAAVAERLEQAGAVLVAKLATMPLAGGSSLWFRGKTRSPWNPRLDASGSSSGPAAAAAAGLVGFSIGTETSASIVGPASRCGVVGLRPTYGRVSRFGCMQLCWSLDKIGPICRTVDDCALVLAAIQGADPRDAASVNRPYVWPSSRELSTIRVGYVAKEGRDERDVVRALRKLGAQLVPVGPPNFKRDYGLTTELQVGLVASESAAAFDALTRRGEPKGVKGWPQYHLLGNFLTAVDYLKLNRMRAIMMQRFDKLMQAVDVFLCDDWIENREPNDEWDFYDNMTGHPKIAFPQTFQKKDGFLLPRSEMMVGRLYDESTLLAVAQACHQAAGLTQRPPLDRFLSQKDEILAGEESPDENKYYPD